jgi:hypothetical protein
MDSREISMTTTCGAVMTGSLSHGSTLGNEII